MNEQPPTQPDRRTGYALFAILVIAAIGVSLYTCDRDKHAYERSQQEDWDRRHGR